MRLLAWIVIWFGCSMCAFGQSQAAAPSGAVEKRPPTVSMKEGKAHLVKHVAAVYPAIANLAHVAGDVVLGVQIDAEGNVTQVVVLSGPEMLRAAAVDAVKQYKYRPFMVDGAPAVVRTAVQVKFALMHPKSVE
ncbi:MAG: energy transducer TonB [Acidobacteria bacterium]|nr:energy transducer TonB [Acidobacteriota bacterium]